MSGSDIIFLQEDNSMLKTTTIITRAERNVYSVFFIITRAPKAMHTDWTAP